VIALLAAGLFCFAIAAWLRRPAVRHGAVLVITVYDEIEPPPIRDEVEEILSRMATRP
jgi:hypothetical protein